MFKKLKMKLIAKYLEKQKDKLVELLPEHLQNDFHREAYVAGGSIWSLYNYKKVNDIDVFIQSEKLKRELVAYFKNLEDVDMKLSGRKIIYVGKYKGERLVVTPNAITIGKCQIVIKDIGKPEDVISRFDFKHNMSYVNDGKLFTEKDAYYLELNRMIYNDKRARDLAAVIMRIPKFLDKGMTISRDELRKILLDVNKKGLNNDEIQTLKDNKNIHFGSGN